MTRASRAPHAGETMDRESKKAPGREESAPPADAGRARRRYEAPKVVSRPLFERAAITCTDSIVAQDLS